MEIKSIDAGAAIALAAGVGFASVADVQLASVAGFEAQAMTNQAGSWGG